MKLRILTHSGQDIMVDVSEFNVQEMEQKINNHELLVIAVGDMIFSRIDIKNIIPIYEDNNN